MKPRHRTKLLIAAVMEIWVMGSSSGVQEADLSCMAIIWGRCQNLLLAKDFKKSHFNTWVVLSTYVWAKSVINTCSFSSVDEEAKYL